MSILYVGLDPTDRALLNRIAANSGAAVGRPVSVSEVVRQLVRDVASKDALVHVGASQRRSGSHT